MCILKSMKHIMSISSSLLTVLVKSLSPTTFLPSMEKNSIFTYTSANFRFIYFEAISLDVYKFRLVTCVIN